MADWTCPQCDGQNRVVVTDGETGAVTNRCLAPSCGYVEPVDEGNAADAAAGDDA